jgi:tetratricopeptide (TPR) repeat protein
MEALDLTPDGSASDPRTALEGAAVKASMSRPVLLYRGRPDEALTTLDSLPDGADRPGLARAYAVAALLRGRAFEMKGLGEEAMTAYRRGLALDPDGEEARRRLKALRQS